MRCTWFLQFAGRAHSSSGHRSEILLGKRPNPFSTFGTGLYLPLSQNSKLFPLICRPGTEPLTSSLELNWDKNALTGRIGSVTLSQPRCEHSPQQTALFPPAQPLQGLAPGKLFHGSYCGLAASLRGQGGSLDNQKSFQAGNLCWFNHTSCPERNAPLQFRCIPAAHP